MDRRRTVRIEEGRMTFQRPDESPSQAMNRLTEGQDVESVDEIARRLKLSVAVVRDMLSK